MYHQIVALIDYVIFNLRCLSSIRCCEREVDSTKNSDAAATTKGHITTTAAAATNGLAPAAASFRAAGYLLHCAVGAYYDRSQCSQPTLKSLAFASRMVSCVLLDFVSFIYYFVRYLCVLFLSMFFLLLSLYWLEINA